MMNCLVSWCGCRLIPSCYMFFFLFGKGLYMITQVLQRFAFRGTYWQARKGERGGKNYVTTYHEHMIEEYSRKQ